MNYKNSIALAALVLCGSALAADPGIRLKFEMSSCPTSIANILDENGSKVCVANNNTCSAGTCSGTAPTTSSTSGMSLKNVSAFRLEVCAASGQTLSGSGTMKAYVYDPYSGLWFPDPDLDKAVTQTTRCQSWPDFTVGVQAGRVMFVASSVTASGGAALDVLLTATAISQ